MCQGESNKKGTQQAHVEVPAQVPVPRAQEEVAHAPKAAQHERNHHFHAEEIVDVAVEQK